ncbi:MAG: hypothetical protein AB7G11_02410 [Phycisphaerales bacterium]
MPAAGSSVVVPKLKILLHRGIGQGLVDEVAVGPSGPPEVVTYWVAVAMRRYRQDIDPNAPHSDGMLDPEHKQLTLQTAISYQRKPVPPFPGGPAWSNEYYQSHWAIPGGGGALLENLLGED